MSSSFVSEQHKKERAQMNSKTERKITYPIALLLSIPIRKTFEGLSREIDMSGDSICRLVEHHAANSQDLIKIVKTMLKGKRLFLIIDDTLILKIYSKVIQGTSDNYDSSDGKTYRSLCSIVALITDGEIAIPIDQSLWIAKEFNENSYAKKWEIAQKLIEKICKELPIYMVLADGLYAIFEFLRWLISRGIKFEMRFHANRVISDKNFTGQIKRNPKFKMSGRRPKRTIRATWQNIEFYFTAVRRVARNGHVTIIYQISNYKTCARQHAQFYGYRWNIEKFFRTAKQKLGLNDCQSRKQKLQENHLFNVFFAYALSQYERKKHKLKNVETAIKRINRLSFEEAKSSFMRSVQIFGVA